MELQSRVRLIATSFGEMIIQGVSSMFPPSRVLPSKGSAWEQVGRHLRAVVEAHPLPERSRSQPVARH